MGVDRCVSSSAREILVLSVGDVEVRLWVTVLLGQTKVDHVDLVAPLANAHQEVVGLDITVNEVARMHVFDSRDLVEPSVSARRAQERVGMWRSAHKLICKQKHSLEREFALAKVEQVFEGGAEKVDDHGVVVTLNAEPSDKGHADASSECLEDFGFVL